LHLDARVAQGVDASDGVIEGAGQSAERIVGGGARAVEADADARDAEVLELVGDGLIDEGRVGGDGGDEAALGGVGDEFVQVVAHEGFATGEDEDGVPACVGDGIDEQVFDFVGGQLVGGGVGPFAAAVDAAEVAGASGFPEHYARCRGDIRGEGSELMGVRMGHGITDEG